jgi:hypothetical protein
MNPCIASIDDSPGNSPSNSITRLALVDAQVGTLRGTLRQANAASRQSPRLAKAENCHLSAQADVQRSIQRPIYVWIGSGTRLATAFVRADIKKKFDPWCN